VHRSLGSSQKKLNGEIKKKRIRKNKENYLRGKCRQLEEHSKKGRTKKLYQQIRDLENQK